MSNESTGGSVLDKLGLPKHLQDGGERQEDTEGGAETVQPKKAEKAKTVEATRTEPDTGSRKPPEPKTAKKKAKKKRAKKKASVKTASDPLSLLNQELSEIAAEAQSTSEFNQMKAQLRSEKALLTQLGRFSKRVTDAVDAAQQRVDKLQAKLGADRSDDDA